jgi:hypothetical protein
VNPIVATYELKRAQVSDIYRHLPTLYSYATQCEVVAEFGVRGVVSTWAFLRGLLENNSQHKELICVDVEDVPEIRNVQQIAADNGIRLTFQLHDSATCSIPTVDLLFIDTWHVYGHLKRELSRHHAQVRKYILMHDTELDGTLGESLREHRNVAEQVRKSGYSEEEICCGLQRAINEFLAEHGEWTLLRRYHYCCGLTVLARAANVRITPWDRALAGFQNSPVSYSPRRFVRRIAGR